MSTNFFTNTEDKTVFEKFKGILENMKDVYAFHAVVGYFRSSGYFALQEYLKNIEDIKILVGINVDQMFADAQRRGLLYFGDEEKTKEKFSNWFIQDMQEAKYFERKEKKKDCFYDTFLLHSILTLQYSVKLKEAKEKMKNLEVKH